MGKCVIACRVESYAPFVPLAYEHLAGLGIQHVEIPVPATAALNGTRAELQRHGLTASSLHGECDVRRADVADQLAVQMPAFAALGARIMFVSVKAENTPLGMVYSRLREAGAVAEKAGVTIVLETHPDLVTNAEVALTTMRGIDHPNVRINYDTANVYYYNHAVDTAAELRRITPYVAAVHLKDTDGGYKRWNFPALGRGVVPFAEVFAILDAAQFSGPYTLEIEGLGEETRTQRMVCDRVAESVGYLRGLGRL
jgi:L-ribulose-5-phosphate 3-epimerase